MKRLQTYFLASACAALAGVAFAPGANAYPTCQGDPNCSLGASPYTFGANDVFGGGSSLVAPYWRQTSDCYANPADLIVKGSPPTFVDEALFNFKKGKPKQNCATQHIVTNATTWYISTGSGSGILALFSHDASSAAPFYGPVNEASGNQYFPEVLYGASDAGLNDSTDVYAYDNGGSYSQGSTTITLAAPGAASCSSGAYPNYPNPAQCYGPIVQFPISVDPVAVFYTNGGIYEKVAGAGKPEIDYKLNVQNGTKDGGLRLSVSSLCGIFNGNITNWNDSRLTTDNGGVSLESTSDPTPPSSWSVPLYAVGRADSSGTTSIITRHLANVCQSYGYNLYQTGATTLQKAGSGMSAIIGNTWNPSTPNWPGTDVPGKITLAANSSGVAQYTAFTQAPAGEHDQCPGAALPNGYTDCIWQNRVGYVGADYVLPNVKNSHTNSYNLFASTLQDNAGDWVAPTSSAALVAFSSIQPPQSDSNGNYCSSCTTWGYRDDPGAWVESPAPTEPLADPTGSGAYPIVGTTNFLSYTCYASTNRFNTLIGQLNYQETAPINTSTKGVLGLSGLAPLPSQWLTAIEGTFVKNTDGLNLNLGVAGTGAVCSQSGIVGG